MRLRALLILLALLPVACASVEALKVQEPAAPIRVQGTVQPIAVGVVAPTEAVKTGEVGNFHGGAANIPYSTYTGRVLDGMDGKFRLAVYDELENAGYPVVGEKHNILFEREIRTPPGTAFSVAGTIAKVRYDTYSSIVRLATLSEATVDWVLTDVRTGAAVYRATTDGGVQGPDRDISTIVDAVRDAFRHLLSDEGFVAKLRLRPG